MVVAGSENRLCKASAQGGGPQIEFRSGKNHQVAHAFESFDGKWLYFTTWNEAGIWRIPVAGGAPEQMLDEGNPGLWANSQTGFYLLKPNALPTPAIEHIDIDAPRGTGRLTAGPSGELRKPRRRDVGRPAAGRARERAEVEFL